MSSYRQNKNLKRKLKKHVKTRKMMKTPEYNWNVFLKMNHITDLKVFSPTTTTNSLYTTILTYPYESIEKYLNSNYSIVIVAEMLFIMPRLSLFRWEYFEKVSGYASDANELKKTGEPKEIKSPYFQNKFFRNVENEVDVEIFDITQILIDADILKNIDYSDLLFLPYILNSATCTVSGKYFTKEFLKNIRPFIDLLIPPKNYWLPMGENVASA